MMQESKMGRIHSIQSLGALDGPGIRFVVFLQGCPLRCACCHNPDTWSVEGGEWLSPEETVERALRYREYFGNEGGITLSGGEPLLQSDYAEAVFSLCRQKGIHTCLDTSGCIFDDSVKDLLEQTDRVLLDIKYTEDALYRDYVGCGMERVMDFLAYVNSCNIPVTLRQVIIPSLNDTKENILALAGIARQYSCVDGVELLPFRKLCQVKYDRLGLKFPFGHLPEPSAEQITQLEGWLGEI